MHRTRFDFSTSDIHRDYDAGRSLDPEARAVWIDDLRSSVDRPDLDLVLDLGCGTGRFTFLIRETFSSAVVLGADPAQGMLGEARGVASRGGVRLIRAEAESLPFADRTFPLVVLSMVYHHLPRPTAALREVARILRLAGLIYLRTPTLESMRSSPWDAFFPSARAISAATLPARAQVLSHASDSGVTLEAQRSVRFVLARTPQELVDKIARRAMSSLRQIPESEFGAGLSALQASCRALPPSEPIFEELEVFVLRRP